MVVASAKSGRRGDPGMYPEKPTIQSRSRSAGMSSRQIKTLSKNKNWMYGSARLLHKQNHGAKILILISRWCSVNSILK
jgi:hypothetical protein